MSAAEPATPERPYLNTGATGSVIDITTRRYQRGAAAEARGRWTAMDTPPASGRSDLEDVADVVEGWFNQVQRSLSNKETAAVYVRTLDVVEHILKGAVAQDLITEEERLQLAELMDAARQAPQVVTG